MKNVIEFLENNAPELVKHLNEREKLQIKSSAYKMSFRKEDLVRGDQSQCIGVICVLQGTLRTYVNSPEGKEVTLFHVEEGEISVLSAACVLNSITFDFNIVCESECVCWLIPTTLIAKIQSENLYLENFLLKEAANRFSDVIWTIEQLLFVSIEKRIANYLHDQMVLRKTDEIHITHDEIAKNIGSAREVVSRALKGFEKTGALELRRGYIVIKDKKQLFN